MVIPAETADNNSADEPNTQRGKSSNENGAGSEKSRPNLLTAIAESPAKQEKDNMSETQLLTVTPAPILQNLSDVERAAKAMSASGFFKDSAQAAQAVVKILAGQELGFGPFASMTGVNIIQGKPVLAANLLAAAVKRAGKYNYRVTTQTEKECVLTWYEGAEIVGTSSFTMEEAARAGLSTKDNWKKYPSDMLFARALSRGQKRYAPDVFNGATVYTPDEMGASVNDDGNVIEAQQDPEISDKLWEHFRAISEKAERLGVENIPVVDRNDITRAELTAYGIELSEAVKAIENQNKAGE